MYKRWATVIQAKPFARLLKEILIRLGSNCLQQLCQGRIALRSRHRRDGRYEEGPAATQFLSRPRSFCFSSACSRWFGGSINECWHTFGMGASVWVHSLLVDRNGDHAIVSLTDGGLVVELPLERII